MLQFLVIGAQKSGTTWLYVHLRNHPELALTSTKEVHFWDWHYDRGMHWYQSLFNQTMKPQGDFTPAYSAMPVSKIEECYRYFPNLRLIYIVRDPIERGWSSLSLILRQLEIRPDEISDQFIYDYYNADGTRRRSNYLQCIENWRQFYRPEQLLVMHFDDIRQKPVRFLKRCAAHIGINPEAFPPFHDLKQKINSTAFEGMHDTAKQYLQEKYAQDWERLQPYITRV